MRSLDPLSLYNELKNKAKVVAVSKNHSWAEVKWLYDAGCRDFGENKIGEALAKMDEAPPDVGWHFIGTLQKNKVSKIAPFKMIHSIDSLELAQKIAQPTRVLLQVNIAHKHGFKPEQLKKDFESLKALSNLKIEGLMTMAPFTDDPKPIKDTFKTLRLLRDELGLKELSMGMSNDYQIALDEGATILRIGTLFFEKK